MIFSNNEHILMFGNSNNYVTDIFDNLAHVLELFTSDNLSYPFLWSYPRSGYY